MKEYNLKVEAEIKITEEDIDDIMVNALGGGITYWCDSCEVIGEYLGEYASDQISRGGKLRLYDIEEGDVYTLTLDKFLNGVRLWYVNGGSTRCTNMRIDVLEMDGCDADAIVQYALFGEIVYG